MGPTEASCTYVKEIASHLRDWVRGTPARHSASRLIGVGVVVAGRTARLHRRLFLTSKGEDVTIPQLVCSLLAELFATSGDKSTLAVALEDYVDCDDIVLFRRYESILYVTIDQALAHRWPEKDPQAAKFRRRLRTILRTDSRFRCFPVERPVWFALAAEGGCEKDYEIIDGDTLLSEMLARKKATWKLGELLIEVLQTPGDESERPRVVEISEVVWALQKITEKEFDQEMDTRLLTPERPEVGRAARQSSALASEEIAQKLARWEAAGRLEPSTRKLYESAICGILNDLTACGELERALWEYLADNLPGLDWDRYRAEYRSFDGLVVTARTRFFANMRKMLK